MSNTWGKLMSTEITRFRIGEYINEKGELRYQTERFYPAGTGDSDTDRWILFSQGHEQRNGA